MKEYRVASSNLLYMTNPTQRFSSRVENYVKYRPSYPAAIIDLLTAECGLTSASVVADIGSGTGLLTELLLKNGGRVFGVEPNTEMREAGERFLRGYPNFTSTDGTAEATGLPTESIDLITAGQAFHWFDREKTRPEFARILKPGGWVALVWNERRVASTPFLADYERLLKDFGTDYEKIDHRQIDHDVLSAFFVHGAFQIRTFENSQVFDYEGLKGRVLSSSYTPEPGNPKFAGMLDTLAAIFARHQVGGSVSFDYDTNVYYGRLTESG